MVLGALMPAQKPRIEVWRSGCPSNRFRRNGPVSNDRSHSVYTSYVFARVCVSAQNPSPPTIRVFIPSCFNPKNVPPLQRFKDLLDNRVSASQDNKLAIETSKDKRIGFSIHCSEEGNQFDLIYTNQRSFDNESVMYVLYNAAIHLNFAMASYLGVEPDFSWLGNIDAKVQTGSTKNRCELRLDLFRFAKGVSLERRMRILCKVLYKHIWFSIKQDKQDGILIFSPDGEQALPKGELSRIGYFVSLISTAEKEGRTVEHSIALIWCKREDKPEDKPEEVDTSERRNISSLLHFFNSQTLVKLRENQRA